MIHVVLILALAATAALAGAKVAAAPPAGRAVQAATTGAAFVCPMHPDVHGAKPGLCPRCGMRLVPSSANSSAAYVLEAETVPAVLRAGERSRLTLRIRHPSSNAIVSRFIEVHEKLFHLFLVSHDLRHFEHLHPVPAADGSFTIELTLPRPGAYQLYADFLADGGTPQLLQRTLLTSGVMDDPEQLRARLQPAIGGQSDRGVHVKLQLSAGDGLVAGRQEMFRFHLTDAASGAPVTDLEPYLGAAGHALIIGEDLGDAVHSHPVVEFSKPNGPDIVFEAVFPRPGLYKLWAQFQRRGQVAVVSFTLPVSARQ